MTLILSHGPWSIAVAKLVDAHPGFRTQYTLNEGLDVDSTYRWNWKAQTGADASDCTFTFANLALSSPITWSTSADQRAWQLPASGNPAASAGRIKEDYVHIELKANFIWDSDVKMGRTMDNWHAGHAQVLAGTPASEEVNCSG
ncbi:hypothetical protein [Pseudomonas sp. DG56-2]|uniref:hypothetical protein n=1 Tax=Pseudomonas sp. DG56-2 TaxID=2320270 RepID=UPI0010A5EFD5|nr:hypothetical protein [Pseudomonas sp. DG56-2]